MKRKVNRVGTNTLTVSLPSKWAKNNNIQKGDELEVVEEEKFITLGLANRKEVEKKIVLNIDKFTYHDLARHFAVITKAGYSKITLIHNQKEILDNKSGKEKPLQKIIKKIVTRNLGWEIISQTDKKTIIECFIKDESMNLERIEKRIYFLIKEMINAVLNEEYSKEELTEKMYLHHDNIAKFINYYLRELQSIDGELFQKQNLYSLYMTIDKIIDKIRHFSERIEENGLSAKTKKYAKEIFEMLDKMFVCLHKKKFDLEMVRERYLLVKKIQKENFTLKEQICIDEIKLILDCINDFSEAIVSKNLSVLEDKQ